MGEFLEEDDFVFDSTLNADFKSDSENEGEKEETKKRKSTPENNDTETIGQPSKKKKKKTKQKQLKTPETLSSFNSKQLNHLQKTGKSKLEISEIPLFSPKIFSSSTTLNLPNSIHTTIKHHLPTFPLHHSTSPRVLVVCISALRCIEVVQEVKKELGKETTLKVGKLFAKHMKFEDQVHFLKTSRVDLAVGTPNRILKLFNEMDGFIDGVELVVVDSRHVNKKEQDITSLGETRDDLFDFVQKVNAKYVDDEEKRIKIHLQ